MNSAELKEALLKRSPVEFRGQDYCVHQIVYESRRGKIAVIAGLMDKNNNCIVYADPAKVVCKSAQ